MLLKLYIMIIAYYPIYCNYFKYLHIIQLNAMTYDQNHVSFIFANFILY